jgi:hypothetical protein
VEEEIRHAGKPLGAAVGGEAVLHAFHGGVVRDVPADVEVEEPVEVVVEKTSARRPPPALDARRTGRVVEASASRVAVQHVAAEIRHVQVIASIVVNVPHREAASISPISHSCRVRDVLESAAPDVAVESICRLVGAARPAAVGVQIAVHEVEIEQRVAVIVDPAGAADHLSRA